jgi:thymidylate synthase (FAD)
MKVTLIDKMGSDLSVVNAARVSFGKKHERLTEGDKKLIKYLASHGHWTTFGHCSLSFRIEAPIFVARQLVKHTVGLCWNEISRRYVDYEPDFWTPEHWRARAEDKKQGSSDEYIDWLGREERTGSAVIKACEHAIKTYNKMIEAGVCPEQARMVLPQNTLTEWIWSGSLYAFARVCNLRCQPDAQLETQEICWEIDKLSNVKFPVSWEALR